MPLRLNGLKTLVITNVFEVKPQSRRVRRVAHRETKHYLPTPYSEEPNKRFEPFGPVPGKLLSNDGNVG